MLGRFIRKISHRIRPFLVPFFRYYWRLTDGWLTGISLRRAEMVLKGRVFDSEWYADNNDGVADYSGGPLADHYFRHGAYEGRKARFFDSNWYFKTHAELQSLRIDAWTHYQLYGRKEGRSARFFVVQSTVTRGLNRDYKLWLKLYDKTLDRDVAEAIRSFGLVCEFDLIFIVAPGHSAWLVKRALKAIQQQTYSHWRCYIGVCAGVSIDINDIVKDFANEDSRFQYSELEVANAGDSLERLYVQGTSNYVCVLGPVDCLNINALFWVAYSLYVQPDVLIVFADEDRIDSAGRRSTPYFKPDINYELLLSHNYLGDFTVFRRDLLAFVSKSEYTTVADFRFDLILRTFETSGAEAFAHVARVLNHVDDASAIAAGSDPIKAHMNRTGIAAEVLQVQNLKGFHRVRWPLPVPLPLVSIIIPTRDRVDLLRMCIDSLLAHTTYAAFEIIIVDNGSVEPATLDYFDSLHDLRVRILRDPRPFNFSALNNAAVRIAKGEFICLMNNDIEVITPDWLEEMVSFASRPDTGCVGALLWYPDDTLQHGGVLLGFHGVAGHRHKFLARDEASYANLAALHQSLGAVTAAVLVVRKSIYQAAGGLDESLAVAFNDVDFCLKVAALGYRNVYTPFAEMYHHESASRGAEDSPQKKAREKSEIEIIKTRYGDSLGMDPSYSPNLALNTEDLSFAFPPRVPSLSDLLRQEK